jgi:hypothetical protein
MQQIEQGTSLSHAAKQWWAKATDVAWLRGFSEYRPGLALTGEGYAICTAVNRAPGDCAADQGCHLKAPTQGQGRDGTGVPPHKTVNERRVADLRC